MRVLAELLAWRREYVERHFESRKLSWIKNDLDEARVIAALRSCPAANTIRRERSTVNVRACIVALQVLDEAEAGRG